MWPDRQDCEFELSREDAQCYWRDIARIYYFLTFVADVCYQRSWPWIPSDNLQRLAQTKIGYDISPVAFKVASKFAHLRFSIDGDRVKFPPTNRLSEYDNEWREELGRVESLIQEASVTA